MRRVQYKKIWRSLLIASWLVIAMPHVYAQQSSSSNYQVNEVQFGSGGNVDTNSTSYNANSSFGGTAGGSAASTNFKANSGFLTQNEPYLEIGVISSIVDLGVLSSSATQSGAGSFYVRAYTSGGYSVINVGTPPKNEANIALASKTTLGAPIIGREEFGMNLVKNNNFCGAGCHLGVDPVPVPDSTFATGAAATGYNTDGQFKYNQGDTIANAPNGDGQTNFTVSFIANINGVTPAGVYKSQVDFVVVASY